MGTHEKALSASAEGAFPSHPSQFLEEEDPEEQRHNTKEGYTLKDLYDERVPLYEKYADVVAELDGKDITGALKTVLEALVS